MVDVRAEQQLVPKDLVATHAEDHRRRARQRNLSLHPLTSLGTLVGFVVASGLIVWIKIGLWCGDRWKRGRWLDASCTFPNHDREVELMVDGRAEQQLAPKDLVAKHVRRVSLDTAREIRGPIEPQELLIGDHRSKALLRNFSLHPLSWLGLRVGQVRKLFDSKTDTGDYFFEFRDRLDLSDHEIERRLSATRQAFAEKLRSLGNQPKFVLLVTGATGFIGREIITRTVNDARIARVICLIRPKHAAGRNAGEDAVAQAAVKRGRELLASLGIVGLDQRKFEFIGGDIELPGFGLSESQLNDLASRVTHVVHLAANVSFDVAFESSYRANVEAYRFALELGLRLQNAGGPFLGFIALGSCYAYGRRFHETVSEGDVRFPRGLYNNYYEFTKAVASQMATGFLLDRGLRITHLLPSCVIGVGSTGNNHGDCKIVNAPLNTLGRSLLAYRSAIGVRALFAARIALEAARVFPFDLASDINLVPLDRVTDGVLAALDRPQSIGEHVHLAAHDRLTYSRLNEITREEMGIGLHRVSTSFFMNIVLPLFSLISSVASGTKLGGQLRRVSDMISLFGGYAEAGATRHGVGNDTRVLGLPIRRPEAEACFRMLCRHNFHVQRYGKLRNAAEIGRRERVWAAAVRLIEAEAGMEAGHLPKLEFDRLLRKHLNLLKFDLWNTGSVDTVHSLDAKAS